MQRFLPSFWLLGAAVYAAAALLLDHSLYADALLAQAARETVRAKQIATVATTSSGVPSQLTASLGATATLSIKPHRNEWVQVAGYTTVVHARPSPSSPVISAYPAGQQLRVLTREAGFARVQDLASGHLGWIEESSLAPTMRGYRVREMVPPEPQVAVVEPAPQPHAAALGPVKIAVAPAPQPPRRTLTLPVAETAVQQESEGGFFRKRRGQPELIAAQARRGDLPGLVQRAFSGY